MAVLKIYHTVEAKLPQLPVTDGNLVFTTDTCRIYMDINGLRLCYDTIKTIEKESDREFQVAPIEGYYYVMDTNVLWNYSGGSWKQLTPSNLNPITIARGPEDFPAIGDPKTLYVGDDATYKWDAVSQSYLVVANRTEWNYLL